MYQNNHNYSGYTPKYFVQAADVHDELRKLMLADGFDFVLDLQESQGSTFVDKINGKKYFDFFSFFAAIPISINHPKLRTDEFIQHLGRTALNKPSNSDIYTEEMASFIRTFSKIAVPDYFNHIFLIDGGALAVENALKTAFDWKVRKNFSKGFAYEIGHKIIHFEQAFHGRSGYTMSLTNTDPTKVYYYPKFNWPRIVNPKLQFPLTDETVAKTIQIERTAISQIKQAFSDNKDDIAAIIIEPIQCEGGDNHFRKEFLNQLKELCLENEALLIFDEVQTGVGISGKMWAHQHYGVEPDIMSFGKKTQVCGILAGPRVDEVENNVFRTSSRINSTWGGNLVDMVRSTRNFEIIEEDNLIENSSEMGKVLAKQIESLVSDFPHILANPRGLGLLRAFSFHSPESRNKFRERAYQKGMIILGCGDRSIRFRPTLDISEENINLGMKLVKEILSEMK
jgi:L-lysine 6-transaminase